MSSPDINYPQQPTYGEGMADAMERQMQMLLGTGDFADIYSEAGFEGGDLATIMREVEAPLRQQTAQVDTDVLRQTLLGTEKQMKVQQDPDTGKFGIAGAEVVTDADGNPQTAGGGRYQIVLMSQGSTFAVNKKAESKQPPQYQIIDTETGGVTAIEIPVAENYRGGGGPDGDPRGGLYIGDTRISGYVEGKPATDAANDAMAQYAIEKASAKFRTLQQTIDDAGGDPDAAAQEFTFTNPNIPTDASKAGQPGYDDKGNRLLEGGQNVAEQTITVREGDGMVDLLGDRREIVDYQTRQATEADVNAGLASEVGESITEAVGTGRQAGFSETGEFQGASALAEDIQAGNLSRQRERDISDVERLSGRFQNIMDEFKPAAASGIQGAKDLIEEQKDKLTSASGTISLPTELDSADYAMSGDAAIGQGAGGEDTLRSALLADARGALSDGLTDREKARISEAFKGQSTMMGRTFDQSAGIAEAQAQTLEDRNRQMQNRAFAQSALGQEAGLQTGDATRAMTSDQFNIGAKMDAERLNEQLRQQGLANYIGAVGNLAAIEDQYTLDPFAAILGRGGGGSLSGGQGVLGSASYGLQSGPQYLNPEAGLGYISQMAANNANMYAANQAAQGSATSGLLQGLGTIGGAAIGAFCWVAREVYGPTNPSWLRFRMWMFSESPDWFFKLYGQYGERFASWISDKPRIKSFIRKWMDSKIKE
jgi:hypothetical protein